MKLNPYIAGNPVGGGDAFIGRADVLREVLRVLRNPGENALVLYGQRRIGKTSVLQELAARLPAVGPYRPVFFDLQDKAALPLANVLHELAARIAERLGLPLHTAWVEDVAHAFREEFIPEILTHLSPDTSLVLLFDEFDVLDNLVEVQAGAAFFPYLRDLLALDPRLQFIFVIGRRPEDMSSLTLSVFKGVKSRSVSLMSPEETAKLVRLAERNNTLRWSDEAIAQVYSLTGGHPFLIQQLCQEVWEQVYQDESMEPSTVSSAEVETAAPLALRSANNALEWLWDGLKPAQRVVASALAGAGSASIGQSELERRLLEGGVRILIDELQDAPRVLQEWDLIEPVGSGYCFRVEILRRWIVERKPLRSVQKEIDQILPVAENLFQAAYGLYQGGNLEQAVELLRQALGLNPNHLRANTLLAELLLAQGELAEAQKLLQILYQYQPAAARPRLVQALLLQAQTLEQSSMSAPDWLPATSGPVVSDDIMVVEDDLPDWLREMEEELVVKSNPKEKENQLLAIYDQILQLEPNQPEAIASRQQIWEGRGDTALGVGDLEEALQAYLQVDISEKIQKVKSLIELGLGSLYRQTLMALQVGDHQKVRQLLAQILLLGPENQGTANYPFIKQLQDQLNAEIEARQKVETSNRYEVKMRRQLEMRISLLEIQHDKDGRIVMIMGAILFVLVVLAIFAVLIWPSF